MLPNSYMIGTRFTGNSTPFDEAEWTVVEQIPLAQEVGEAIANRNAYYPQFLAKSHTGRFMVLHYVGEYHTFLYRENMTEHCTHAKFSLLVLDLKDEFFV